MFSIQQHHIHGVDSNGLHQLAASRILALCQAPVLLMQSSAGEELFRSNGHGISLAPLQPECRVLLCDEAHRTQVLALEEGCEPHERSYASSVERLQKLVQVGALPKTCQITQRVIRNGVLPGDLLNLRSSDPAYLPFIETILPDGGSPVFLRARSQVGAKLNGGITGFTVVSGPCLFGTHGAEIVCADGAKVSLTDPGLCQRIKELKAPAVSLELEKRLSLYEVESLQRLLRVVSSLALRAEKSVDVMLHVPRLEYYCYALELTGTKVRGEPLLSQDLYRCWIEAVDERSGCLKDLARRLIPPPIKLSFIEPLLAAEKVLRNAAGQPGGDILKNVIASLAGENEPSAPILAPGSASSLSALVKQAWVSAYLQAGECSRNRGNLALAVEGPQEEGIFIGLEHALKANRELRDSVRIAGLYVAERLLMVQERKMFPVSYAVSSGRYLAAPQLVPIEREVLLAVRTYFADIYPSESEQTLIGRLLGNPGEPGVTQ